MNGQQFADKWGVEMDWRAVGYKCDDGWEHQLFKVTFTYLGTTWETDWRQGLGIDHDPTIGEVLEALAIDYGYAGQDFEEFCEELGYDTDSRRAHASWGACRAIATDIRALFTYDPDMLDDFASIAKGGL